MATAVKLKELRQLRKLTQKQAGEGIGIDQRQWNRYENGQNELPVKYLKAICIQYGVSADWILGIK